jgi:hypothetical protein
MVLRYAQLEIAVSSRLIRLSEGSRDDHTQATYPLTGPTIGVTRRRIFMLDLGVHDWRKARACPQRSAY